MSIFQHAKNLVVGNRFRKTYRYKGCIRCNCILYKNPSPPIWTFELNNTKFDKKDNHLNSGYVKIIFCKNCWDELTVQERIDSYISNMNKYQDVIFTIKSICRQSNVSPTKYIRKLKLEQLSKNRKTL